MNLIEYITTINKRFQSGLTTEHSFRGDLQNLLESWLPDVMVTNEPTRIKCGAPDYIITRKDIPVGYIEAKDLGADLNSKSYKEQFDRYREALDNLIITNYLDFQVYKDGAYVSSFSIAQIEGNKIVSNSMQHEAFITFIKDFSTQQGQTIKSSAKLASMMASKAKMLAQVIESALNSDETSSENSTLQEQMKAFKDILIHDIKPKEFADIYAQTIAYGMFAARLHDPSLDTFTRKEAAELIPRTNPFLRRLFQYIAGYDLDNRIVWIVDALADIFRATDVATLLKNFGKSTQQNDPIIHFYETFLSEYDPKLRKARGVWYTPEPVVKFIVRAVDDILKTEFGLADGLADTSKTKIKIKLQETDKRYKSNVKTIEEEVHKVQILDPATGTATFLAEVVKYIYKAKFEGQQGIWSNYVENHLLPRLNGFELLMASYAMAHLKLDMLLTETGYKPTREQRFRIYLTNSLEEHHQDTGTLFANWLSTEANEANHIKRDTPVMCVLGNPPYSGISSNNGEWIRKLIEDYKYVDGVHFNERKHWLNDDYVKFLRYGQHFIEKNGSGVLAFINNHSFIDNPTFRGMRWHLLNTFDTIYIIDLHGNAKKKEISPEGTVDKNVFDIQAGVSINIFIKKDKQKKFQLADVKHFDIWGSRKRKYDTLLNNNLKSLDFTNVEYSKPFYFFKQKSEEGKKQFETGFRIDEIFKRNSVGFVSANDGLNISLSRIEQINKINELLTFEETNWRQKYKRPKDARDWTYVSAKNDAERNYSIGKITRTLYRPFDVRFTCYTGNSRGLYSSPQPKTMVHFINGDNLGLVIGRQGQVVGAMPWNLLFITNLIADFNLYYRGGGVIFPLYLYPENNTQQTIEQKIDRTSNLNSEIVKLISDKLGLIFSNEKETTKNTFAPIDILDYIYAVLHSPYYREKYKEFLKIDFPRVPYPSDAETFWKLTKLGGELRTIHLLENPVVNKYITQYPIDGNNIVTKLKYQEGKVYINETQYFDNVPQVAWDFYIGGYQPAQKWLKDRKERKLEFDDILHYQKIIVALSETDRLMKEIDKINIK